MRIIALWLIDYHSGNGDQFFSTAIRALGHELKVIPLDIKGAEAILLSELDEFKPDLIFHIPYKRTFVSQVMRQITKMGYRTLSWNGDDEWLWHTDHYHNPKNTAHDYSWCVTTSKESLKLYESIGYKNVVLASWGYSAVDWKPKKRKKEIDVYFCGAKTPQRDIYLKELLRLGIKVGIDGPGYGIHTNKKFETYHHKRFGIDDVVTGKVPLDVMVDRYRHAKIGLNFLMGESGGRPYKQVKARAFEIPAVGTFQLTYDCPELGRFFERGKEVETFNDPKEMCEKILYYLEHEKKREEIARRGHERNKNYSYEKILSRVFKEVVR